MICILFLLKTSSLTKLPEDPHCLHASGLFLWNDQDLPPLVPWMSLTSPLHDVLLHIGQQLEGGARGWGVKFWARRRAADDFKRRRLLC